MRHATYEILSRDCEALRGFVVFSILLISVQNTLLSQVHIFSAHRFTHKPLFTHLISYFCRENETLYFTTNTTP